jgi:hypothetical protein
VRSLGSLRRRSAWSPWNQGTRKNNSHRCLGLRTGTPGGPGRRFGGMGGGHLRYLKVQAVGLQWGLVADLGSPWAPQ